MNYIQEINAFVYWLETNPLEPTTQALWFHLQTIALRCGYPEWVTVANITLQAKLHGIDKKTLIRHRQLLCSKGLILYKKSDKREAGKYHLNAVSEIIGGIIPLNAPPITPPDAPPSREPKTPPLTKEFNTTSKEYRLSEKLFKAILLNSPTFKSPDLQKWSRDMDLILRIDKRDPEEVASVIDFAQADSFWKSNILSVSKLRKQYDTLNIRRLNSKPEKKGGCASDGTNQSGRFAHLIQSGGAE